ncbi:hypothetical protein CPLU01_15579 [Colletotrichum plurivorum]|uniref:Uncharacterized protein n=1 Tax=Colletotrichum plurivorum TaxID=2175906 RepID=A0A8H6J9D6_9PEZI|nr:hypothetical protein CPLU01_15579 [Colletotrichum plurivorum]
MKAYDFQLTNPSAMASQPPPGSEPPPAPPADPDRGSGPPPEPSPSSRAKRRRDAEAQLLRPSLVGSQPNTPDTTPLTAKGPLNASGAATGSILAALDEQTRVFEARKDVFLTIAQSVDNVVSSFEGPKKQIAKEATACVIQALKRLMNNETAPASTRNWAAVAASASTQNRAPTRPQTRTESHDRSVARRQLQVRPSSVRLVEEHEADVCLAGKRGRLEALDAAASVDHAELVVLVAKDDRLRAFVVSSCLEPPLRDPEIVELKNLCADVEDDSNGRLQVRHHIYKSFRIGLAGWLALRH